MFAYHPLDMFVVDANRKSFVSQGDGILRLRAEGEPDAPIEAFDVATIDALRQTNQWRYYPHIEAQGRKLRLSREQGFALSNASKKDREKAIFIFMEIMAVRELRDAGEIVLTPQSLEQNWDKFTDILNNREKARYLCGRVLRAGEKLPLREPHKPATLLKKPNISNCISLT